MATARHAHRQGKRMESEHEWFPYVGRGTATLSRWLRCGHCGVVIPAASRRTWDLLAPKCRGFAAEQDDSGSAGEGAKKK